MADLVLTRAPDDRRLYVLESVGTLRLEGLGARRATAEAGNRQWRFGHRGVLRRAIEATDAIGGPAGDFEPRGMRRGGTLRWAGRELALRPASRWRERYALVEGEREMVVLDGKGWGKRPVTVTVEDLDAVEPGLLLFAAFVVRGLAEDSAASASAATAGGGS